MEQILSIAINSLGFERVDQILAELKQTTDLKKPVEKPKKAKKEVEEEKPKKAKKEVEEEKPKRISRMSPNLSKQFSVELEKVGLKFTEDDKKAHDKVKKDFVNFVDNLSEDDFTGKNLADHMRDFAKTKATGEVADTAKKVPNGPPKDGVITELDLKDLQGIEYVAVPTGDTPVGVLWDASNGRWVTGPKEDEDEENSSVKFSGKKYAVGETTGRVYLIGKDGEDDTFVGFLGVGQFKTMKA